MRIAIVSSDLFMLSALECVLSCGGDFEIVGSFGTLPSAELVAQSVHADLLLVTEEFSDDASLEVIRQIRSGGQLKTVLCFSGESAPPDAVAVFDAVQSMKAGTGALCRRIKTVLGTGFFINQDPPISVAPVEPTGPIRAAGLAPREYEVAQMLAQGYGNRQISKALSMTEATVKVYVGRLLRVFECENRTQLALKLTAGKVD